MKNTRGFTRFVGFPPQVEQMIEVAERTYPNRNWYLDIVYFDDGDFRAQLVSSRRTVSLRSMWQDVFQYPIVNTENESIRDGFEYFVSRIDRVETRVIDPNTKQIIKFDKITSRTKVKKIPPKDY